MTNLVKALLSGGRTVPLERVISLLATDGLNPDHVRVALEELVLAGEIELTPSGVRLV